MEVLDMVGRGDRGQKPAGQQPKLKARDVCLEYVDYERRKRTAALAGVNFDLYEGEFVSIVGPSGCGKTTFLSAVDGLLKIDRGAIEIDGRPVKGPGPDRAMVFQQPALLPWRTVLRNVAYGLELQDHLSQREVLARSREQVRLAGLTGFEEHFPYELSGGMQQRVNLARALVCDPSLLLMDEPLASLDAQTRELMQVELLRVWESTGKTTLFITHQIDEACFLSDRVVVMSRRPAVVKEVIPIRFPRPRDLSLKRTPAFIEVVDHCWRLIESDLQAVQEMSPGR
jgi:NitT/TauT family transport system ATP-binding protein